MVAADAPADAPWSVPSAWGAPLADGILRQVPEDFRVDEALGFAPSGEGEHWLLRIRKRDRNTMDVVEALSERTGVRQRDIGFCGMKDRRAVTTQWFSLPWPLRSEGPDFSALDADCDVAGEPAIAVIEQHRHDRKLRRGAHRANHFVIRVRLAEPLAADALDARMALIQDGGVPNGFGPQRFGRSGRNLSRFLTSRKPSGIMLSAARSAVFNAVLARRVTAGTWNRLDDGEWCMLDGTRSGFCATQIDDTLNQRCAALDVHPTGPMPGRAADGPVGTVQAMEDAVIAAYQDIVDKLVHCRVEAARRPLRVRVDGLSATASEDGLVVTLSFALPSGAFATSVVDQCFAVTDARPPVGLHRAGAPA